MTDHHPPWGDPWVSGVPGADTVDGARAGAEGETLQCPRAPSGERVMSAKRAARVRTAEKIAVASGTTRSRDLVVALEAVLFWSRKSEKTLITQGFRCSGGFPAKSAAPAAQIKSPMLADAKRP